MPGFDETSTSFRSRVADPGGFQAGSFRTVVLQRKGKKVMGVVGRKKGSSDTSLQTMIFEKDEGWTKGEVQTWLKTHAQK